MLCVTETVPGIAINRSSRKVRNTDIGSLKPDSTSRTASNRFGTATRDRVSSAITAPASVGAAMAPATSAGNKCMRSNNATQPPTTSVVMATPIVASNIAGQKARRSNASGVCRPPWNRITASATLPTT